MLKFNLLDDEKNDQNVNLLFKDILASGEEIGGYSKDNCYLTIFDTGVADDNWYLGTQALKDLVLIFYQDP